MTDETERLSKTYRSRTDFELDVQLMRAKGWVLDAIGDHKLFVAGDWFAQPDIISYLNAPTRIAVRYRRR
ncbi:MAG: hypothetical protein HY874_05920 [Chloroflexi bacterium]|nr:hypothetical protein [Chloroflexota bacterium]